MVENIGRTSGVEPGRTPGMVRANPIAQRRIEFAHGGKNVSSLIAMAQEFAALGPPIDYARIAQIRQAIADGAYSVNAEAIARVLSGARVSIDAD